MPTLTAFQAKHLALLCKCTGTSFVTGAVNHDIFNNPSAMIIAGVGIALFFIGGLIDEYLIRHGDKPSESLFTILAFSMVMSLGMGAFAGSIQHYVFPNSQVPHWVMPLGVILTGLALIWSVKSKWNTLLKPISIYIVIATLIALVISALIAYYI